MSKRMTWVGILIFSLNQASYVKAQLSNDVYECGNLLREKGEYFGPLTKDEKLNLKDKEIEKLVNNSEKCSENQQSSGGGGGANGASGGGGNGSNSGSGSKGGPFSNDLKTDEKSTASSQQKGTKQIVSSSPEKITSNN